MPEFKVGDRVMFTPPGPSDDLTGKLGTIVCFYSSETDRGDAWVVRPDETPTDGWWRGRETFAYFARYLTKVEQSPFDKSLRSYLSRELT